MLKGTTYLGRTVIDSITFEPNGTFTAIHAAEKYLKEKGYTTGSMCRDEPIGFADADKYGYIAKWYNIAAEDRNLLDGVIIPYKGDFREGGAEIIFFNEPK